MGLNMSQLGSALCGQSLDQARPSPVFIRTQGSHAPEAHISLSSDSRLPPTPTTSSPITSSTVRHHYLNMDDTIVYCSPSFKHRVKQTLCCFRNVHSQQQGGLAAVDHPSPRLLLRSSSQWVKSRAQDFPELKYKCRNLIRMGSRRRAHSSDFGYDPLSYALNFDEGGEDGEVDEFPLRSFSSRLPPSPTPP
ncbi:hypothetical protein Ancab_006761 [Ancistrocladus abbreviatus]